MLKPKVETCTQDVSFRRTQGLKSKQVPHFLVREYKAREPPAVHSSHSVQDNTSEARRHRSNRKASRVPATRRLFRTVFANTAQRAGPRRSGWRTYWRPAAWGA
jgi:hypothetical protein